jgi:hypothetical protein
MGDTEHDYEVACAMDADCKQMKGLAFSTLSMLCSRTDEEAMWRVKTHDDHHEFSRLAPAKRS